MSHGQGKPQNGQGNVREFCEGSWLDTLYLFRTTSHSPDFEVPRIIGSLQHVSYADGVQLRQLIDGLMQERRNSIANALELRLSRTNTSECSSDCNKVGVLGGYPGYTN